MRFLFKEKVTWRKKQKQDKCDSFKLDKKQKARVIQFYQRLGISDKFLPKDFKVKGTLLAWLTIINMKCLYIADE